MRIQLHLILVSLLCACCFTSKAFATDFYTASPSATLAGNSGAVNTNWTTNPDGLTGLATIAIAATDNLIILDGGIATITAAMSISALNINAGGTIIHNNNATASSFNVNGLLTWNGTIKTLNAGTGSNFFGANGNVTGTTAIHDAASTRGIYLGGDGLRTINLIQTSGVVNTASVGFQITKNRILAGNCKWYSPIIYNSASGTIDLAGYNLQVSSIQGGTATRLIKGNAASNLTLGGVRASTLFFDPVAMVLNNFSVDNQLWPGASSVTIGSDLTVNSLLDFGVATATTTRTLQVNGNFTLGNNGILHVQAKGTTASTQYDQLRVTGNVMIGNPSTIRLDLINSYATDAAVFTFVQATAGTASGSFSTTQVPAGYTGLITYPSNTSVQLELAGPPPPPACSMSLTPDLPLEASNPTVEAEIETIIQRFSDAYLGTAAPTAAALTAAIDSYNALGITVSGYTITGNGTAVTNFNQLAFLKTFAQHLKFNPNDTDILTKATNTVWLVSDRLCNGSLSDDYNQYDYRVFVIPAILIPRIKENAFVKSLFENVLYQHHDFDYFWGATYDYGINVDHMGNSGTATLGYVKWIDSADERYRYMKGFKRFMERFFSHTQGTSDGIKPDGSGFHHQSAYTSYMYDFNLPSDIVYYLRETSFQVSSQAYLRFRDAIMAQTTFANDNLMRSLSMAGRKPYELTITLSRYNFRNLAVAGGSILGTGASDPVLATYYNRVWGSYAPFGNNTQAVFNSGYFQFNHSMAGIYRKDNWLAVCKGFSDNMFGAEIFSDANRYGRYQSYGAVEIIYPGDALTGNGFDVTNWNWNYNPGTTVIRLPWDKLHAEKERLDEIQQKKFVGSLSFANKNSNYLKAIHGTYGVFAMDFQEAQNRGWGTTYSADNHNPTFAFKKSVFTFDNMLICLGSGIGNNDTSNTTLTTLFQRKTRTGNDVVNADGNLLQASTYDNTYTSSGNHWLVDNYSTGFYVFAGSGDIKLTRADQQTPQHTQLWPATISANPVGNYAIGYIDHGLAPTNQGYEYVCIPKATASDMTNLHNLVSAGNKPYTVHRKDHIAHIVEYRPASGNAIFGYSFFSPLSGIDNNGQLTGADYPCLVMTRYDSAQKDLQIAVTNPDLGFTWRGNAPSVTRQINITIEGTNWEIIQTNAAATITGTANGETNIQFTTVDGLPIEIVLSRVLAPQTITFDPIPTKTYGDPAFDLTATASSGLTVSYSSSNTGVATISNNTVTIVGAGTSIITASQAGNDIYEAAVPVQQTLIVNELLGTNEPVFEAKSKLYVYPNPVTDYLNIQTSQQNDLHNVQVFDMAGKLIKEFTEAGNKIPIGDLPQGNYLLKVKEINKTCKFIKK